jgi:hypothetical protein
LRFFHQSLDSPSLAWATPIFLVAAFAIPLIGFGFAMFMHSPSSLRRLGFASMSTSAMVNTPFVLMAAAVSPSVKFLT